MKQNYTLKPPKTQIQIPFISTWQDAIKKCNIPKKHNIIEGTKKTKRNNNLQQGHKEMKGFWGSSPTHIKLKIFFKSKIQRPFILYF